MFKYMIIALGVAGLVSALLAWRNDHLGNEIDLLNQQIAQKNAIIATHEKNVKITEEVSNAYENNIAKLRADLDRLRKRPARCVAVTRSTSGNIKPTAKSELPERNGLSDQWLYDYAGRAEQTRLTLLACQSFINQVKEGVQND